MGSEDFLSQRVCIVAGAARGIGEAIALEFQARGAKLVLTDIDVAALEAVAARVCQAGGQVLALDHDVASEEGWKRVMAAPLERFEGHDVLVNNAGIIASGPVHETSFEVWQRLAAVNMGGVFLGTKYAVLTMKDDQRRRWSTGAILNISSVGGLRGSAGLSAYCMTKGGVRLFTKAVAAECGAYNIRANTIHPGTVDTEMGLAALRARNPGVDDDDLRRKAAANYPLGRISTPLDIARAAAFLASENASHITGIELVVDGGLT